MITANSIFQCEVCLRYFDADKKLLAERILATVPEMFICSEKDCAEINARRTRAEKTKLEFKKHQKALRITARAEKKSFVPPSHVRSSCPPEREDVSFEPSPQPPQLSHADEQARFAAQGDGVSDCNKMLAILASRFDVNDSQRLSRGEWVSNSDLIYVHKIPNAHSRASQLRGSETLQQHEFIATHRLDVDTKWFAGGWCYSLCFIEHSERLKREREKQERGQKTF